MWVSALSMFNLIKVKYSNMRSQSFLGEKERIMNPNETMTFYFRTHLF